MELDCWSQDHCPQLHQEERYSWGVWISMFGVRAESLTSCSRYPSEWLLSVTSDSTRVSFSWSKGSLDILSEFNSIFFVNPTILSQNLLQHGLLDKFWKRCVDISILLKVLQPLQCCFKSFFIITYDQCWIFASFNEFFQESFEGISFHVIYQIKLNFSWCCASI